MIACLKPSPDTLSIIIMVIIIGVFFFTIAMFPTILKAIYVVFVETLFAYYLVKLIRKMFEMDKEEYDYDDEDSHISDASFLDHSDL
ncbi:Protein CBG26577 [Caenorhabditis briggsae]|uniref:Protein CBG26577 n=2 Tax=Caenorhabditis briggsae TaxID=6238 RepID=B6IFQ6_CAEBR|nr:Protein CBG26577 [Caenorhabditis briggsae]ULU14044.1 hypothetical protein L3Y34_016512 [Caenorhabditis briggsae]CAR98736.1 Protein CBG26577 [Caenorhabditis briggsae]